MNESGSQGPGGASGGSPGTVALVLPLVTEVDVRAVLPAIRVQTLVLQHTDSDVSAGVEEYVG